MLGGLRGIWQATVPLMAPAAAESKKMSLWYDGDLRQEALQRRIGQYGTYLRCDDPIKHTFVEDLTYKNRWTSLLPSPAISLKDPDALAEGSKASAGQSLSRTSTLVVQDFLDAAAKLEFEED